MKIKVTLKDVDFSEVYLGAKEIDTISTHEKVFDFNDRKKIEKALDGNAKYSITPMPETTPEALNFAFFTENAKNRLPNESRFSDLIISYLFRVYDSADSILRDNEWNKEDLDIAYQTNICKTINGKIYYYDGTKSITDILSSKWLKEFRNDQKRERLVKAEKERAYTY